MQYLKFLVAFVYFFNNSMVSEFRKLEGDLKAQDMKNAMEK